VPSLPPTDIGAAPIIYVASLSQSLNTLSPPFYMYETSLYMPSLPFIMYEVLLYMSEGIAPPPAPLTM